MCRAPSEQPSTGCLLFLWPPGGALVLLGSGPPSSTPTNQHTRSLLRRRFAASTQLPSGFLRFVRRRKTSAESQDFQGMAAGPLEEIVRRHYTCRRKGSTTIAVRQKRGATALLCTFYLPSNFELLRF